MWKNTLQIRFTYEDDKGGTIHCQKVLPIKDVDSVNGDDLVLHHCGTLLRQIKLARTAEE